MDNPLSADWRAYPLDLVRGDPQLCFPAAEGNHPDCESDTWFVAGELTADSGRRFAFLTIFNKNRPGLVSNRSSRAQQIVADFYTGRHVFLLSDPHGHVRNSALGIG